MKPQKHIFDTYAPTEIEFVRGEGMRLFDDDGRDYLDCAAGIAVNFVGLFSPPFGRDTENPGRRYLAPVKSLSN